MTGISSYGYDDGISRQTIKWLIGADIVMSVILEINWPGAAHIDWHSIWPDALFYIFRDLIYGLPVLACLCLSALICRLCRTGKPLRLSQKILLVATSCCTLVSGCFPMYSINHYDRYRLGVAGFLLPFIIALIFLCDFKNILKESGFARMYNLFIILFTVTTAFTLLCRVIVYCVKL